MKRRHFLGISAAVTGALLGGSAPTARRHFGIGTVAATDADPFLGRSERALGRIVSIEGADVSVRVLAREPPASLRLFVRRREYPDGDVLAEGRSERIRLRSGSATVDVEVPIEGRDSTRWFYEVTVVPAGRREDPAYLCESGPYRWAGRGAQRAARTTEALAPAKRERFARERDGNDYVLRYGWRDATGERRLRYRIRRSVHEAAVVRERGYVRTFEESLTNGVARDLAAAIADAARQRPDGEDDATDGAEAPSAGELFESLVRFVQALRYARDVDSMGEYDYNRTVEETVVAGVGDCKDKTHLLAGLLAAPPLSCDSALLFQPAHVLLGVAAEDVPSPFDDRSTLALGGQEYLPVDPSLRFDVGDYPDATVTAAYGDGEWLHYDVEAIGRGLDRNVRDLFGHAT